MRCVELRFRYELLSCVGIVLCRVVFWFCVVLRFVAFFVGSNCVLLCRSACCVVEVLCCVAG